MATKSSNTQGNPYHDEATGEFTSKDGQSASAKNENDLSGEVKPVSGGIKLKAGVDLSNLTAPKAKFKDASSLNSMIERLNDLNQVSNIPRLQSARDIENNIEQYFSKQVTDKLNEMYGKNSDCASYQFHPKSNPWISLNLFTCVLGKYRYKDNHAHLVTREEFDKIMSINDFNILMNQNRSWGSSTNGIVHEFQPIFRGITSRGQKRLDILNSY